MKAKKSSGSSLQLVAAWSSHPQHFVTRMKAKPNIMTATVKKTWPTKMQVMTKRMLISVDTLYTVFCVIMRASVSI